MEMELLNTLLIVARSHEELPDTVVEETLRLALIPQRLTGKERLLQTLLDQIAEYDPYAGVGCFGSGTTLEEIRQTLKEIRS